MRNDMNKNIKLIYGILLAASFALAGCSMSEDFLGTRDSAGEPEGTSGSALVSKAVNSPEGAMENGLLVRLTSAEDKPLLGGGYRLSPVFPSVPGKEAVEKKYGLDRWFMVSLPEGIDIVTAAQLLDKEDCVERIEYGVRLESPCRRSGMPVSELTKAASEGPVTMNDPLFKSQWFLHNNGNKDMFGSAAVAGADVNIRDAWRLETGDPSVIVAVVDEGIKYTHPDLAEAMWVNEDEIPDNGIDDDGNGYVDDVHGYNFLVGGPVSWGKYGDVGHATHVAGLVGAVNNNGIGISSVAGGSGNGDGVRLMSCQIFSGSQQDNIAAYAAAIKYAADNGASVLQCSFGQTSGHYASDAAYEQSRTAEKAAIDYFLDPANANCKAVNGNIVVFSAGNDGGSMASYPGAYRDYICVGAISQDNLPAWYTNYGPGVNIAAPGGDNAVGITMLSTVPSESDEAGGDYAFMHGTSMATPVVSGIVALGLSYALELGRTFDRDEFKSMVLTSVNSLEPLLVGTKQKPAGTVVQMSQYKGKMGTGTIDAWKLLMNIEGVPFVTVKVGEEVSVDLADWLGADAAWMTVTGVEISAEDREALGLENDPVVEDGALKLRCSKVGSGRFSIRAVAGGYAEGTASQPGGMAIARTVSVVSRHNVSQSGGWL